MFCVLVELAAISLQTFVVSGSTTELDAALATWLNPRTAAAPTATVMANAATAAANLFLPVEGARYRALRKRPPCDTFHVLHLDLPAVDVAPKQGYSLPQLLTLVSYPSTNPKVSENLQINARVVIQSCLILLMH